MVFVSIHDPRKVVPDTRGITIVAAISSAALRSDTHSTCSNSIITIYTLGLEAFSRAITPAGAERPRLTAFTHLGTVSPLCRASFNELSNITVGSLVLRVIIPTPTARIKSLTFTCRITKETKSLARRACVSPFCLETDVSQLIYGSARLYPRFETFDLVQVLHRTIGTVIITDHLAFDIAMHTASTQLSH